MSIDYFFRCCATLGPIGYLPASGTFATLVTCIALFFVPYTDSWHYILFVTSAYLVSYFLVKRILVYFKEEDPSQIVIDEVIGCLITFYAVPISVFSLFIGFLLFRFFDISKIGPVGWFEKMKGAAGIMLDDVVAGFISNIVLRCVIYLCTHY